MEDHREKDKRVEEDAMRRFFSSQPTGFICPILNGPCSTMTEAEEIEAELHTRIKELEAQLKAAEAREARLREGLVHYARQNGNYYTPYASPHFNDGGLARSLLEVKDVTNTAGGEGEK